MNLATLAHDLEEAGKAGSSLFIKRLECDSQYFTCWLTENQEPAIRQEHLPGVGVLSGRWSKLRTHVFQQVGHFRRKMLRATAVPFREKEI